MGDLVNLRMERKRRKRATDEDAAATNRARHGRTLDEKRRDADDARRKASHLDAHKREKHDGREERD